MNEFTLNAEIDQLEIEMRNLIDAADMGACPSDESIDALDARISMLERYLDQSRQH